MYNDHPFHNFEFASVVSMTAMKLLNRINDQEDSYGIGDDPLISFAVIFSALIHDVDYDGVPNKQLIEEKAPVAAMYKNKSVAEQNSIDVGWELLMEPAYKNLRRHIYTTVSEFKLFRQLVVNLIIFTDIADQDLMKSLDRDWSIAFKATTSTAPASQRKLSSKKMKVDATKEQKADDKISKDVTWDIAYPGMSLDNSGSSDVPHRSERYLQSLRATVTLKQLMQLSTLAPMMWHWTNFNKWNERLFEELYVSYAKGRNPRNPKHYWYDSEIVFFDFFMIPLAKKINQCRVYGVSGEEILMYAVQNRDEWKERGQDIVNELSKKFEIKYNAGIERVLANLEDGVPISGESVKKSGLSFSSRML